MAAIAVQELRASLAALALHARRAEFERDHQRRAIAFGELASCIASTERLVRTLEALALRDGSFSVVRRP